MGEAESVRGRWLDLGRHSLPAAPTCCWHQEGTPDGGSLRVEGGAHIPAFRGPWVCKEAAVSMLASRGVT